MEIGLLVVSILMVIIVGIFGYIFINLTTKWGKKRVREISERFDSELNQLKSKQQEIKRLEKEISILKVKKMELIKKGEIQKAREIEDEIIRLQKNKDKIHRVIESRY
ncbi:MAG: hypothetical protein QXY45_00460 [Candidatus Aenigmatarchaeota archaeon]